MSSGCVYGLLLSPDVTDPLDTELAFSFYSPSVEARSLEGSQPCTLWLTHCDASIALQGEYEVAVLTHTKAHATDKTREQL